MRTIDADALKELFSEVIGHIAKKPEMNGNLEHMIRASAMVIQMIDDAPSIQPEPRTAYWTKDIVGTVVCSNCGGIREDNRIGHTQWCNCCGCFMRGE